MKNWKLFSLLIEKYLLRNVKLLLLGNISQRKYSKFHGCTFIYFYSNNELNDVWETSGLTFCGRCFQKGQDKKTRG